MRFFKQLFKRQDIFKGISGHDEIKWMLDKAIWEKPPNPNIRNCVQIGRLVKNEPDIEMAIRDEIQNFKEYGVPQLTRSTDL
ncbi:MAG: hypothetical protein WCC17_13855 [Candidatus Nitrosopolaris sp.]